MAYSTLQNLHSGIQNVLGGQGLYFGRAAFIDVKMMLCDRTSVSDHDGDLLRKQTKRYHLDYTSKSIRSSSFTRI